VKKRYADFDEVQDYCRLSANPVGNLLLHLYDEVTEVNLGYSDNICTSLQLINFWQDIYRDYAIGRIYLPQDDLQKFGCTEQAILQRQESTELRTLVRFETTRAREYYAKAQAAFEALPACDQKALTVAEIMRAVYFRILQKIEGPKYQIFGPRARLTTSRRLAVAAGVWLRSRSS